MSKVTYEIKTKEGMLQLEAETISNNTVCSIIRTNNVRVVISNKEFNEILADARTKKFDIFRYDE